MPPPPADMPSCPACGEPSGGFGHRTIRVVAIEAGAFVRKSVEVNRYRCRVKACRTVFRDGPPLVPEGGREIVAMAALRDGFRSAGRYSGYDDATVRSILSRWVAERDVDRDIPVKDEIGFMRMRTRDADVVVAYDPVDDTVLDIVPGLPALRGWIADHAPALRLAVVGIEPELVAVVRATAPEARLAVPPSVASEAVASAGRAAVRAIARKRSGNFRENADHVVVGDDGLDEDARDALRCWSPAAKVIRRTVLALLAALSGDDAGRDLASADGVLAVSAPGSGLAGLLRRWGALFAEGVRERWVDPAARRCGELLAAVATLRPHAVLDMVRAVVLHQSSVSLDPVYAPSVGLASPGTSPGTRLDDALDAVRSIWGPHPGPA